MKIIPIFIALALLALGCEEIVYVEVPGKTDTLKIEKFIDRYFVGTDTVTITQVVEVPVPTRQQDSIVYVTKLDTIYIERVDSVFVTETITEIDTVFLTRYLPGDTLWLQSTRLVHYFPSEVIHIVQEFYVDAEAHGRTANVVYIDMRFKKMDAVLQAMSYQVDDQWHIYLNDNLSFDEMYLPVYREMARIQFGKEYSQDPESVMYPFYDNNKIRWSNRNQFQDEINEFFE